MKVAISSDWHGNLPRKQDRKKIEECEVLLLCGDILPNKSHYQLKITDVVSTFISSLTKNGTKVVMVPGNQDFNLYNGWLLENPENADFVKTIPERLDHGMSYPYTVKFIEEFMGATVLIDNLVEINSIKIYGTPWSPDFCRWAFMHNDNDLAEVFQKIPENADILLTHTPPAFGQCRIDICEGCDDHLGSYSLANAILEKKPRYMFCGHIHTGSHEECLIGETTCRNVSLLDEEYKVAYSPTIMEF